MIFGARRALVVAHPDDEALWFGGLLARYRGGWTVICCSIPRVDPIRAWKFYRACEALGARGELMPFVEPPAREAFGHLDALDLSRFDCIVTHGALGEYGHLQHTSVHHYVAGRWPGKTITGCYGMGPGSLRIALTDDEWRLKCEALACYDHVSPTDGLPKGEALVARYGGRFDLRVETYAA